jgi:hypothetical protein
LLPQDLGRARATLERMMPLLPEDQRREAAAQAARLAEGPTPPGTDPRATIPWDDVVAGADKEPDPARRARLLRLVYEGCQMGYVSRIPGALMKHISRGVDTDPSCRAWTARILGTLGPRAMPLLGIGLYDPDATVRTIALEVLGESEEPAALLYLLPLLEVRTTDLPEYQTLRHALSLLTGHQDLPAGRTAVETAEDVAASREAWRRWRLSDASTAPKVGAIRRILDVGEPTPERLLHEFVQDPVFDVMREAYVAMRTSVARPPLDPAERKAFPRFPAVPDAEVTRAGMRSIQQREMAWWQEYSAERLALIRAESGTSSPPPR